MAAIYAFTRLSRRRAAKRGDERKFVASEASTEDSLLRELRDPNASFEPLSASEDGASTRVAVDDLGGIFAPRREMSDAELSVDVGILAGLRASYESTLDGTVAPASPAPHESVSAGNFEDTEPAAGEPAPAGVAADDPSVPAPGAKEPLAIDMSLPLVYLTLLAKDKRLSGRAVLDALEADGFLPGLMQLYYRPSDFDPAVVVGVANMVESGALDPESLSDTETPGLVPFMGVAEDPAQALKTFNTMVAAGRRLAQRLQVTLCDETRSALTPEAESRMRAQVGNIARRSGDED